MSALDEILAIPGNRTVYQRLRDLLDERKAIAFAGAGVSAPLYPLWPGLLKSLANAPVEEQQLRTAGKRPLQVAAWAERDACEALTKAWRAVDRPGEALRYADRAAALNRRLKPTTE